MPAIGQGSKPVTTKPRKVIRKRKSAPPAVNPDQMDRTAPAGRQRHRARIQAQVVRRGQVHAQEDHRSPDAKDVTDRSPAQKQHDAAAVAQSVATSRRKAIIRKRQTKVKEILKAPVNPDMIRANANTGAGPTMFHANIDRHGIHVAPMAAIQPRTVDLSSAPGIQRAIADAFNFPSSAIPSMYDTGAGIVEAAQGHPARIKRIASDMNKSDPVLNTAVAGFDAATGDTKNAKKRIRAAGKAASEHPGFTAIEVAGAKGALGRGITRIAKTGVVGKSAKAAVSTTREARTLPGTTLREPQTYSPDALTKAGQVVRGSVQKRKARKLNEQADRVQATNPERAAELRGKAEAAHPTRVSEKEIAKRVDELVDANETVRRHHRGAVVNETRAMMKDAGASHLGPIPNLVAQGIAHANVDDLRDYVTSLEHEYPGLTNAGKHANLTLRRGIEKAIGRVEAGHVDISKVADLVSEYRGAQADREAALAARGMLPKDQAEKSAAIPYAVRRMGATHTTEHRAAAAADLKASVDHARGRVARLETEATEMTGRHRVQRGQDGAKEPQAAYYVDHGGDVSTRHPTRAAAEADRDVHGGRVRRVSLTSREAARVGERSRVTRALDSARKDLADLEKQHTEAHRLRNEPELVDAHGNPLSLEDIHAHMDAHGEPRPAYLSQAPNARNAGNFYRSSERAPEMGHARRTGEATRKGTFDADPETLVEQAARQQGLKDAFDGFQRFLHEFGRRGSSGKLKQVSTKRQADQAIRDIMYDEHGHPKPGAIKWVAVRANPFGAKLDQLHAMLDGSDAKAADFASHAINYAIEHALDGEDLSNTGNGPWVLVPEAAAKRLQEHVRMLNPGNAGRVGRKVNSMFRQTVLATSLPWVTGNVVEGIGRAALAHAGPRSFLTGRRVLRRAEELDEGKGEALAARTVGGGHFGTVAKDEVHFDPNALNQGHVKQMARALGRVWRTPGPKHLAALWHGYTHVVFDMVNKTIETNIQTAMLGKAIRDSDLMDGNLKMLSEEAVDKAARGALDENTAADLGRALDRMYGKYAKWSPDMRKAITLYTPFVAWTLNSIYFVLRTLPRDHPVATLLLASMENADTDWRREHGLDAFIDGAAPAWLQGSIPLPGGGHLRAPARYTPLGFWSDPIGTAGGTVLPVMAGVLAAARGEDWKGAKLKDTSTPGKALAAAESFIEATIPGIGLGSRIAQKGVKGAIVDSVTGRVAPKKATGGAAPRTSSPDSSWGKSGGSGGAWDSGSSSSGAWG